MQQQLEEDIVYLNGDFKPLSEAYISVTDRGFLFADGVYEVVPLYNRAPFAINEHLARLKNSLAAIHLIEPLYDVLGALPSLTEELLRRNAHFAGPHYKLYIQMTRGAHPERTHAFPKNVQPTVLLRLTPLVLPSIEDLMQGFNAITLADIRWDWNYIKSICLLPNALLNQHAKQRGADDAILVRHDEVIETSSGNIFIVKNGMIYTPPEQVAMLSGITRKVLIDILTELDYPVTECTINVAELAAADEIWITSSTRPVLPIVRLDDRPVGNGKPGPIWRSCIEALYRSLKNYTQDKERCRDQ